MGVFDGRGEALESLQWHLGVEGLDLPSYGMHLENTGNGVKVAVLDTAFQLTHPDLASGGRIAFAASTPNNVDLQSWTDAGQGTAVAGVIASAALGPDVANGGGRGIAPLAELLLYPVISAGAVDFSVAANALESASVQKARVIHNSWGASVGKGYHPVDAAWRSALEGVVVRSPGPAIVFPAGNEGERGELSSQDAYASDRHVIAVAGVGRGGLAQAYSEPGSNVLVAAPGGSTGDGLVTTDLVGAAGLSQDDYLRADSQLNGLEFAQTQAAAATVSGVTALMLQANPQLGARELAWILAKTARAPDARSCPDTVCPGWLAPVEASMSGRYSPRLGFGTVNARSAIQTATGFKPFANERYCRSAEMFPDVARSSSVLLSNQIQTFSVRLDASDCPSVIERVEVIVKAQPQSFNDWRSTVDVPLYAGDLQISLKSPASRESVLARSHACAPFCGDLRSGFTFTTVQHMGENALGTWKLLVSDQVASTSVLFDRWELRLYGH